MKKLPLLVLALILAACESMPDFAAPDSIGAAEKSGATGEQLFDTPDRNRPPPEETQEPAEDQMPDEVSDGTETPTDSTAAPDTEPAPDSASTPGDTTPPLMEESAREAESAETDTAETSADAAPEALAEAHYPEQAPEEEITAIPLDEPLVQLPPQVPVQEAPPVEQTPEPAESPPVVQPAAPQTPAPSLPRETPPAEPSVTPLPQPETPPAEPSAEEVPPEETTQEDIPPEPEREPYTPPIPTMPFQPETAAPNLAESNLPYSRTVRALVGQYIEIPFRGPGWVYLGEFGSRRGVRYDSRRMDPDGMTFVFRADTEGTYSLKFNRQDFVRDYILNDYVRVIVEEPPAMTGSSWSHSQVGPDRVYASPRWPLATDPQGRAISPPASTREETQTASPPASQASPAVQQTSNAQESSGATTAPAAENAPATAADSARPDNQANAPTSGARADTAPAVASAAAADPARDSAAAVESVPQTEDWLKKAWDEYNAGRIPGALEALDQFMVRFPGGSDEAYWLYGQSLEANNEGTRDIRLALDYYRRLTAEFPQSSRYDEARRRIVYLERFYFNIQ